MTKFISVGGGALYPEIDQSGPTGNEMSSKQHQSISFHFCLIFLSDRKLLDCSNCAIPTNCQGETKLIFEKIKSVIHGLEGEPENRKEPDQICWGRLFLRTIAFESPKLFFAAQNTFGRAHWEEQTRNQTDLDGRWLESNWRRSTISKRQIDLKFLFSNPMGPFDPKLKGFLITLSGFRVAVPTTASAFER